MVQSINGEAPKLQWDFIRGFKPLSEEGAAALAGLGQDIDDAIANPAGAIGLACGLPERSLLFVHNAQRYLDDAAFVQAICNLRDAFKSNHRTLVLLAPALDLPSELSGDVVCLDEPLPGSSKSLVSKAAGNEAGIPTIELDLGAVKGSLVGQSEHRLRDALKVITSVSNDRSLWIATANSIDRLNTALLRRFPKTFYFDLPDEDEKRMIWQIHRQRCGLSETEPAPDDHLWSGADICNCCEDARDLACPLSMAATWVVPVGVRSRREIDALRKQANGRFLSASKAGVYTLDESSNGRRISLSDE